MNVYLFTPCRAFPTVEAVLDAAVYTVAIQLSRDPLVRRAVRLAFYERAKISCRPTKKGRKVSLILLFGYDLFVVEFLGKLTK